ncbi:hypothetical protein [Jannaschia aquimarina]|uniref:Sulfotransferase family protein n=1 Tax=Jannaschia aquimarina TaxID=935700 RepID=A0A0D1EMH5_9RHOB|nr:hypothetical protein [Jannaschia aquimarina]KIT16890.1 hypothetical protein jaqu_13890 [Jannaschia aquimarina]SNT12251.1 hypothetical protein SAMN05421775_10659 [Jannaschia aquimarina]
MQIAIHLGAHRTDEDLILRTLQRNSGALDAAGVTVPPPGRARPAIRKAAQSAGSGGLMPDAQNALLAEMLEDGVEPARVILSYEAFLGIYAKVLDGTRMYSDAGRRAALLRNLFPEHDVSFFMAIRNPATFVPAIFEASRIDQLEEFLDGHDLTAMRWSEPIKAIRASCPDVPFTVWCHEDLPLLLPEVLALLSGVEEPMEGADAMAQHVMTDVGFRRMQTYLADNPAATRSTWRKVATAFLGKFADPEAVEPEITTEGWTSEAVAALSEIYEEDVARLQHLPGITFLTP